jgi:hypothetical protein
MIKWLRQYNEANAQIKYFALNWLIYGLAIIITTIYCYARLDFVRSYRTPAVESNEQATQTTKTNERAINPRAT